MSHNLIGPQRNRSEPQQMLTMKRATTHYVVLQIAMYYFCVINQHSQTAFSLYGKNINDCMMPISLAQVNVTYFSIRRRVSLFCTVLV